MPNIDTRVIDGLRDRLSALESQVDIESARLEAGEIDDIMEYQRVHDAYQRAYTELQDAENHGKQPSRCR